MSLLDSGGTGPILRSATRRRVRDLDLRLGRSKNSTSSNRRNSGQAVTIVLEDDDDDVQVSSPRSVAQARTSASSRSHRSGCAPALRDTELELRLGRAGVGTSTARTRASAQHIEENPHDMPLGLSFNAAIDLTSTTSDDRDMLLLDAGKRKHVQIIREPSKEVRLTCAICMDTMKEEMSTVCGHIFCKRCIMGAIQTQKKCPTCRRKLTNSNIHRIYISSSTR